MPLVDAADAALWETRWRIGTGLHGPGGRTSRGEIRLGYHRAVMVAACSGIATTALSASTMTASRAPGSTRTRNALQAAVFRREGWAGAAM